MVITEKIDGTNGVIAISEDGKQFAVGSRNRWITKDNDNMGFAAWAFSNMADLMKLGPGYHYGEWWGRGIQRGYGLAEKRFSLFNTTRWLNNPDKPECCHVVPELFRGEFSTSTVEDYIAWLSIVGSQASPGFMMPEGLVIYHTHSNTLFKKTLQNDGVPKGQLT